MNMLEKYYDPSVYITDKFLNEWIEAWGKREGAEEAMRASVIQARTFGWNQICPEEYRDTDPDKINKTRLATVMSFDLASRKGFYIFGNAGTHKTRSIYCLLAREFMKGRSIKAFSAEKFAIKAQSFMEFNADGKNLVDQLYDNCDILFLDDLFKRKLTEMQEFAIYSVLERRMGKPTIITSNIPFFDIPNVFTSSGQGNTAGPVMRRIKEFSRVLKFS